MKMEMKVGIQKYSRDIKKYGRPCGVHIPGLHTIVHDMRAHMDM